MDINTSDFITSFVRFTYNFDSHTDIYVYPEYTKDLNNILKFIKENYGYIMAGLA